MKKITAYMPLLYGSEYLKASLDSLKDHVDEYVILYTPSGSQGHHTEVTIPDTKEELYQIALDSLGSKLIWSERTYGYEGEHRSHALEFCKDSSVLIGSDADEVFEPIDLDNAIKIVYDGEYRQWGVNGFLNFWKSFNYILVDFFRPIRFTNLDRTHGQGEVMQKIYHFSCAQKMETINFKWRISGHKDELFPDWFDKYLNWTPGCNITKLHPTSHQIWEKPEFFDKTKLPKFLLDHPNYSKDLI